MVDFQIPDSEQFPLEVYSDLTESNDQHGPQTVVSMCQGYLPHKNLQKDSNPSASLAWNRERDSTQAMCGKELSKGLVGEGFCGIGKQSHNLPSCFLVGGLGNGIVADRMRGDKKFCGTSSCRLACA